MRNNNNVVGIRARLIRIPLEAPKSDASQKFTALELPLVEIEDELGNRGQGFGYTLGTGGTTILQCLEDELLDLVVGQDSRRIGHLHQLLTGAVRSLAPGGVGAVAVSAIDVALWDLEGKRLNTPLHVLLGGCHRRVLVYNAHVGWLSRSLPEMLELSRRAVLEGGFRALKLKVGKPDLEEDVQRVARVRETVGPDVKLMIDADGSWTASEAISRLKRLEKYHLTWVEEPLPANDLAGLRALSRHTRIARAGGESLFTPLDFYNSLREEALDVLQPDIARIGGITPAMKVCALAEASNRKVSPHISPELSVQIAAAVPNSLMIEYLPQMSPVLKNPLQILDGFAVPSDSPGLGIEFDDEGLARFEAKRGREHGRLMASVA